MAITRFAARGEHRLSYETIGEPDSAPLLALHDLLVDRGQLRPLAEALAAEGFRVSLPDARGHGASAMIAGREYPTSELAADALTILDADGLEMVQVIAVGWGATVALTLAAVAPGRVRSLVLISPAVPALFLDHPHPDAQRYGRALQETIQEAVEAGSKGQTERALDLYLGVRWGSAWREHLSKPRLGAIRRSAANLAPLLAGIAPEHVDRESLRAIDAPVTFLLRGDAPAFERWNAEALSLLIPGSGVQTVTIPSEDEGHAVLTPDWASVLLRVLAAQRA